MKVFIKKIMAIMMMAVLAVGLIGTPISVDVHANSSVLSIEQLKNKFPAGKYWNHATGTANNPDGYTSSGCGSSGMCQYHNSTHTTQMLISGSCGCNSFCNAIQCMGFAYKCGYDTTGTNPTGWSTTTSLSNLKAGDIVRYKNDRHSIFITAVNGDTVTYGDCNSDGHCKIRWDQTISKSTIASSLTRVYVSPGVTSNSGQPSIESTRFEYFSNGVRPVIEIENPSTISNVVFYLRLGTSADWKSYTGKFNLANAWYCEAALNELNGTGDVVCHVYVYGNDGSQQVRVIEKPRILSNRHEFFNNGVRPVIEIENPSAVSNVVFYLRFGSTGEWQSYVGKFNLVNAWYCEAPYDEINGYGTLLIDVYIDGHDGSHQYLSMENRDVSNIQETRYEYFSDGIRPVVKIANRSKVTNVVFYLRFGSSAEWKSYSGKYNLEDSWYCEAPYSELSGTGRFQSDVYIDYLDGSHQYLSQFPVGPCNHEYSEYQKTEATCDKDGVVTYKCQYCDDTKTETVKALGHDYSQEWITDLEPTCTEAGRKSHHCTRCDSKTDETQISPLGHVFGDWVTITSASCTGAGGKKRECLVCGLIETQGIDANGHSWNTEFTVDVEPTCTKAGSKSIHCSKCDAVKDSTIIEAIGHAWNEGQTIKEATCDMSGAIAYECINCHETRAELIEALGHDYSLEWTIDTEPTVTESGSKSRHCLRCDAKTDVTEIPALGSDNSDDYELLQQAIKQAADVLEQGSDNQTAFSAAARNELQQELDVARGMSQEDSKEDLQRQRSILLEKIRSYLNSAVDISLIRQVLDYGVKWSEYSTSGSSLLTYIEQYNAAKDVAASPISQSQVDRQYRALNNSLLNLRLIPTSEKMAAIR